MPSKMFLIFFPFLQQQKKKINMGIYSHLVGF